MLRFSPNKGAQICVPANSSNEELFLGQERVVATYLVETPHPLEHAAAVIAGEQSSGTFVSVPGETLELKERFGAQVMHIKAFDSVGSPSLPGS